MNFIDRKKEIARITRALESDSSRFLVVYGRRRLGKSTLIKRCLGDKDIYFEADLNETAIQIQMLVNMIRTIYPAFADARYESWDAVLRHFNDICEANATLCFDEFPYMVKKSPALPSVIQRLLDSGDLRFNLIICGSSQRMMERIILNASEPLYGRADEKICLRPIPLPYWQEEFQLSATAAFEEYAVWGGVPRYWKLREGFSGMWEAVEELILDEHGVLSDEPNTLFFDDMVEIAPYSSIMTALGSGKNRFSELADAVGAKVTEISTPLANLRKMNYIAKEVPFGENAEKSRKTLYHISDSFMEFYYRFVAPNKSILALGRTELIKDMIRSHFNNVVGHIWERACAEAVSGRELLGQTWGMASRWWGTVINKDSATNRPQREDIEFDVVAESFDRTLLMIGECKWTSPDFPDRLLRRMKAKVSKVKQFADRDIIYVLFLREHPISPISEDEVKILYPEDIIPLLK